MGKQIHAATAPGLELPAVKLVLPEHPAELLVLPKGLQHFNLDLLSHPSEAPDLNGAIAGGFLLQDIIKSGGRA